MNCDRVRERVVAGAPEEALPQHLLGCGPCRHFADDVGRLDRILADAVEAPPDRVWTRLRSARERPPLRRRWRRVATAAAAAAAGLGMSWWMIPTTRVPAPPARPSISRPVAAPAPRSPVPARAADATAGNNLDAELASTRAQIDWLSRDIEKF